MASRRRSEEWSCRRQDDDISFSTKSRRFSGSYIPSSFREDNCITISSFKDEIDPSTYSFTTAIKALQARGGMKKRIRGNGLALNSKWEEAEKYICNPLSGQVPLECLSSKTLTSTKLATSAPLFYSFNSTFTFHHLPLLTTDHPILHSPIQQDKRIMKSRDIGTQSTPSDNFELAKDDDFANSNVQCKPQPKEEEKETKAKQKQERKKKEMSIQGGCLSWIITKRHALHNHKPNPQKTSLPLAGRISQESWKVN